MSSLLMQLFGYRSLQQTLLNLRYTRFSEHKTYRCVQLTMNLIMAMKQFRLCLLKEIEI